MDDTVVGINFWRYPITLVDDRRMADLHVEEHESGSCSEETDAIQLDVIKIKKRSNLQPWIVVSLSNNR